MTVVIIEIKVKPGMESAFEAATLDNARESVKEPGVARFDVLRSSDDPARYTLVEAYRTEDAPAAHKASAHYLEWKDIAEPMMAEPRSRRAFSGVFVP